MLSKGQRALIFWSVCIPLRATLAHREHSGWQRALLRFFATRVGVRWLAGLENGDEGVFGGPAWWREERARHGLLWLAYGVTGSQAFLKADVAYGSYNWISSGIEHQCKPRNVE